MRKLFTLLFAAGIAAGAFAKNDEKAVEIRQTEPAKVMVAVPNAPEGILTVKITDADDRLVLRDRITKTEAFAKRYDLNALPIGTYSIEVSDVNGTLRTATFSTEAVVKPVVYTRVTEMGNDQYRLLVSNLEAKDVTVQIFDGDKLIHTEAIDNPQGLHKIYTITKPNFPEAISFKVTTASGFEAYAAAK
ncbi:hypothetical protein J0A68_19930 [Algoriphagus sp. H41]|uniref:Por secretion system C-terminal sorting domain-containing protein n=1 Tax=Algoriphagus oliviformis TaxID=2811231 RepID=A0ABS3CAN1_9BACT|nr:hypothetical protein [Algoriphagus oliviformis]MBN7813235.1 hypothetical protein [Algoriphagus oliviformis]